MPYPNGPVKTVEDLVDYLKKTDPKLLRAQRELLVALVVADRRGWLSNTAFRAILHDDPEMKVLCDQAKELIEGLTNFLDGIADFMADGLGMTDVLLQEDEDPYKEVAKDTAALFESQAAKERAEKALWVGKRVEAVSFEAGLAAPPLKGTMGTVKALAPEEEGDAPETTRLVVRWDTGLTCTIVLPGDKVLVRP